MPRPEDTIRRYLDAHQGSVTVTVRQALSSWELEHPTPQDRARIARDLAAVGVQSDPPLEHADLDSRVTLRVHERQQPAQPRAEPAAPAAAGMGPRPAAAGTTGAAPSAGRSRAAAFTLPDRERALIGAVVAGGVGSLVALGPDRIYGYGLALGVVALALLMVARAAEPRSETQDGWAARLPWAAGALSVLALVLGVLGSLTIDTGSQAGTGTADARERDEFCASEEGDELTRLSLRGTTSPEELRKATDTVLDIADDAPPGANCAVLALNAIADAWVIFGDFPEYDDAEEQVERIRELQEDRGLSRPAS